MKKKKKEIQEWLQLGGSGHCEADRSDWGWRLSFHAESCAGCWPGASGACPTRPPLVLLTPRQLDFTTASGREGGRRRQVFSNLIWEVMYHRCHHMLLVTQPALVPGGRRRHGVRTPGGGGPWGASSTRDTTLFTPYGDHMETDEAESLARGAAAAAEKRSLGADPKSTPRGAVLPARRPEASLREQRVASGLQTLRSVCKAAGGRGGKAPVLPAQRLGGRDGGHAVK